MKLIIIIFLSIAGSLKKIENQRLYLDSTLYNCSTPSGRADYQAIIETPYNINHFLSFIGQVVFKKHPQYFQTKEDGLACWVNVYNALIVFNKTPT